MPSLDHANRGHALLSASGAERWIKCPPSVRASEGIGDQTSVFAQEGTFAHELSELYFSYMYEGLSSYDFEAQLQEFKENEFFNEELNDYVKEYVVEVEERINEAFARNKDAILMFEERLDLTDYVPEAFGTGDVIVYSEGILEIIDLKFGKGVEVSAIENPQLRLYGLGAYELLSLIEDIHTVKTTIIQPRLNNISTEELDAQELVKWGKEVVMPQAEKAYKGEGEFNAGSHCRFCKIKHSCRARAEANAIPEEKRKSPNLLTDDEVAELLHKIPDIKKWAEDVLSYATEQAHKNNKQYKGWKVVEGRATRKITDQQALLDKLKSNDYDEKELTETKLLSLTKLEKVVGKKKLAEEAGDLIVKPQGKPTLAVESDKRQAIDRPSAAVEFKDL
ncbi:DUF2800 domain-containing protein [Mammaliicoccus sciuri]|uniref:DUF2800 domain-containing protein n=1 Tax=Mammaliicoccus sciuri TaxID=1296 RepID=UPI003A93C3F4